MVYHDGSINNLPSHPQNPVPATVLERVFSFFLDYLIFAPVVSFLNFLVFKNEMLAWRSAGIAAGSGAESLPVFLSICAYFILVFSLMQSFFIWKWQATPGQHFLKIKVEVNADIGLSFLRIFIRQLGFWFSILLLGIPFLAVMAHPEGKTFYDRLTETEVKSLKKNPARFTFEFESRYWRSLIATLTVFLGFLIAAVSWSNHSNLKNKAFSFNKKKKANYFCTELRNVDMLERLQTVVALNLVGQIEDVCVDKEADFVLWKSTDAAQRSLAYYAKSLTEDDNENSKEDAYLKQACADNGKLHLGCEIATAFQSDALEKLYAKLSANQDTGSFLQSTLKYELSILLNKTEKTQSHFTELKAYDDLKTVKKYLLSEMVNRSISNQGRSPAAVSSFDIKYMKRLMDDL